MSLWTTNPSPDVRVAGRYVLGRRIGQGTYSTVWQATDLRSGQPVAVKGINLPADLDDPRVVSGGLLHAVRAARQLAHPAAAAVFDGREEDGVIWVSSELVPARTVWELVAQEGPMPAGRAAAIGFQVLSALRAAHHHGIVHHDVQPGNVLVQADGRAKLVDFGGEHLKSNQVLAATRSSPAVLPPPPSHGPEADLRALGATLLCAVTGDPPRPDAAVTHESAGDLAPVIRSLLAATSYARPDGTGLLEQLADVASGHVRAPRRHPTAPPRTDQEPGDPSQGPGNPSHAVPESIDAQPRDPDRHENPADDDEDTTDHRTREDGPGHTVHDHGPDHRVHEDGPVHEGYEDPDHHEAHGGLEDHGGADPAAGAGTRAQPDPGFATGPVDAPGDAVAARGTAASRGTGDSGVSPRTGALPVTGLLRPATGRFRRAADRVRRGPRALWGVTLLLVLTGLVALAVSLGLGTGTARPAASVSAAPPGTDATPGAPDATPSAGRDGATPTGWRQHRVEQAGVTVAVPPGWRRADDAVRDLVLEDPDGAAVAAVTIVEEPPADLGQLARDAEANYRGLDYRRIRFEPASHLGSPSFLWEQELTTGDETIHAIDLYVRSGDRVVVLSFQAPAEHWADAQRVRRGFTGSLRST